MKLDSEVISDINLFKFFLKKLDKVNFLKRNNYKNEIREITKVILVYFEDLNSLKDDKIEINVIPLDETLKRKNIRKLWELLLKEAIYCLRDEDEVDTNEFKEDFGIIDIVNYFKDFIDFEDLLYGSDVYYRDHTLHIIRVFLLGYKILYSSNGLESKNKINFHNIKIGNDKDTKNIELNIKEREAIWAIISLTHDLGYPIEKIDKLNQKIKQIIQYYGSTGITDIKFHHPIQNLNINKFLLKFISSKIILKEDKYFTVIQNKYFLKFSNAFENFNHGIMSCLLILKYFTYFKESEYSHSNLNGLTKERAKQFLIRNIILRSIASHDNEDIYQIFPNTFSFLLTFTDDLQEWERASKFSRSEFTKEIKLTEFNKDKISFTIVYKPFKNTDFIDHIISSFSRKAKRYIRLFRSAPDSDKRIFNFKFDIKIIINNQEYILITFEYIPKSKPIIKIPFISDKREFLNTFQKYIENDFKNTPDILSIIDEIKYKIESY